MTDAPESPQSSDLCTACGLCCSGAVFNSISLSPEDFERAFMAGIGVQSDPDDGFCIGFPCTALSGADCLAYAGRPNGCREYRCETLKQLDREEISLETAIDRVRQALPHARKLEELIAPETIPALRVRRRDLLEAGQALPDDAQRAELVALDAVLHEHFRRPLQRQGPKFAAVEGRE
jgi:uncharacterized protein